MKNDVVTFRISVSAFSVAAVLHLFDLTLDIFDNFKR